MSNKKIIENIRKFVDQEVQKGKKITVFKRNLTPSNYFKKLDIKVAHVESGLRSFDLKMPEEINRILTDQISDFLFTTENSAEINLKREGINEDKIFYVGNIMIDTLLMNLGKAKELNKGIFHFSYPPKNNPPGKSILIIIASSEAILEARNNVPPLAVPISRINFGLRFFNICIKLTISDLI